MVVSWGSTLVGEEIHARMGFMNRPVLRVFNVNYMLRKYFQKFNTIINEARNYGYIDIQNITRLICKILMEDTIDLYITNKGVSNPYLFHFNNTTNFVKRENPRRIPFTKYKPFF